MIVAALALALAPAPAAADPGPEPAMEEFIALAEAELSRKLRNPHKVTFSWPYRLMAGPASYSTCGRASARKGTMDDVWVSAAVANGKVISAQWSTVNGMLAWLCKRHVKKGELVPR